LAEDDLQKIKDAYDNGRDSVFVNGTNYVLKGLRKIKLYDFKDSWDSLSDFINSEEVKPFLVFSRLTGKVAIGPHALSLKGNDLTKQFFNEDFGWKKGSDVNDTILQLKKHYINLERIEQLKKIQDKDLDYSKLVRICEEINICYSLDCFYAVGNLLRSILDHVPPTFGFKSFSEVTNNYAGTKSFKEAMQQLDNSLRKISDSFLHTPIRKSETLPNSNQVDFMGGIDFLLSEIVRVKGKN
jgi:hypothetical protein